MNIEAQFAEIERIIKEYGLSQPLPTLPAENIERKKEVIFVVSDNTSQPTTDFARYAELASNP